MGTVHRRKNGRWRARLPQRLGLRSLGDFGTEQEALQALKDALAVIEPTDARTVRAWGVIWLRRRAARGLSSFADDQSRWEQHILAHAIADRPVRALQPREVAAFARWLSTRPRAVQVQGGGWERPDGGAPISRQTQQHVLKLLQLALQQVVTEASDLPGTERDVALVLGEDDRALAAAIRLAGRLMRVASQSQERVG